MANRVLFIVLDSVGAGHAPDAAAYGDEGSNTLGNVAAAVGGLKIPHLARLGLGKVVAIEGATTQPMVGAYGAMVPQSVGKDTTNGHMEFVGVTLRTPLPTYPDGFPPEIIDAFEQKIGRKTLGNRPASGTKIIEELGDEHVTTGYPIVYTSGDSVFQIAAHEDVIPLNLLYEYCDIARQLLTGPHAVGRVIARPFVGTTGAYTRTPHRKDYSRDFGTTMLEALTDADIAVIGIGKIADIYAHRGITQSIHTDNNTDGVEKILNAMKETQGPALLFANLVDFDMLYGHRNDPVGFAHAIEAFDERLPDIMATLNDDDLLLISADHGCDPTTPSTDHSRESVPILAYAKSMTGTTDLGIRDTYADVGATIAQYFQVPWSQGTEFLSRLEVKR